MKKTMAAIGACALSCILLAGLAGCAAGDVMGRNPYDVATEFGYEGSEASWLAESTGGSTEARRMYEEAKKDGYDGTYVEFLKEIGFAADDSASVNAALCSTVEINSVFTRPRTSGPFGFGTSSSEKYASAGSGVVYSLSEEGNAYIVTNYHVVYSADSVGTETVQHISDDIQLYLYGDTMHSHPIAASFVGGSMTEDIAVLEVAEEGALDDTPVRAVSAADSDALTVGDRVYAVGDPDGAGLSVVSGIVSVDAEYISLTAADDKTKVSLLEIRTDAPINHGNSGGGLYSADGMLVGIVNARLESSGVDAFGYAIPVNRAFAVAQNVIDNSKTNTSKVALRAMLGITAERSDSHSEYDEQTGKAYIAEKVTVKTVTAGSAASGKLEVGDVLYSVRIDGGKEQIITRRFILDNAMYNVRKGMTVTLVVDRGGETVTVEIPFDSDSSFSSIS